MIDWLQHTSCFDEPNAKLKQGKAKRRINKEKEKKQVKAIHA